MPKSTAIQRFSAVFWTELSFCILLMILGSLGLLIQPRALFTWLPAVLLLMAVVLALSGLVSLDKTTRLRYQQPIFIFIALRSSVLFLGIVAIVLLICGFQSQDADENSGKQLFLTIPMLLVTLVYTIFGVFSIFVTANYAKTLPTQLPVSGTLKRNIKATRNSGFVNGAFKITKLDIQHSESYSMSETSSSPRTQSLNSNPLGTNTQMGHTNQAYLNNNNSPIKGHGLYNNGDSGRGSVTTELASDV